MALAIAILAPGCGATHDAPTAGHVDAGGFDAPVDAAGDDHAATQSGDGASGVGPTGDSDGSSRDDSAAIRPASADSGAPEAAAGDGGSSGGTSGAPVSCGVGAPDDASAPDFLDRIDFGNAASEASHDFDPGATMLPPSGVGALKLTYRAPLGVAGSNHPYGGPGVQLPTTQTEQLTFTVRCDGARQNYLTIKLWGNDTHPADVQLLGSPTNYDAFVNNSSGGAPPSPERFYYVTTPIPIASTQGHTTVQLTLFESNANPVGQPALPIYSAFTSTDPYFTPAPTDAQGVAPTPAGQIAPAALTSAQVVGILQANRQWIYEANRYYDGILARQILPGTPGAPPETVGLDLWTAVSAWGGATKTPDAWRDQIGGGQHGPGYSTFPDELLSVLFTTYLLPPFVGAGGQAVAGLDHDHDPAILQRIVYALDAATYLQASDGRFNRDAGKDSAGVDAAGVWQGLTSTPRAAGHAYAGSTARGGGWTLSLEGVDTQTLGWTIIRLLLDPKMPASGGTAHPANFVDYLGGSFDADLDGAALLRATAYERMLSNHISYLQIATGGTISQNTFQELGMYAAFVALELLQQRFPNAAYAPAAPKALAYVEQTMGVATTTLSNPNKTGLPNYALSTAGFGEAHGTLSGGYDGRYGQILPWLMPIFAQLAEVDPGLAASPSVAAQIVQNARHTLDGYAQFISAQEAYDPATQKDAFTLAQEDYVTYRNPYGANANAYKFNVDAQYAASDPNGPLHDAYALRSAYLEALYGKNPRFDASAEAALNYLRSLPAYESTLRSLIGVDPAKLTALPGEPGQPDFAFADPQEGVVAFMNRGERFYMNANWRNYENGGNALGTVSNLARIHDTTAALDRMALIAMPHDAATVQSDGNLSGALGQPWFVRYGDYLFAFNSSATATTVKLPGGTSPVADLLSKTCYPGGAPVTLPAGGSMILWLAPR